MPRTDYEALAATYDRRYDRESYAPLEPYLVARTSGRRVLEVGCGTGHWLAFVAQHGGRSIGVDPSPAMLERACRRGPVARGCAEALPFAAASFDAVVCINAHHHCTDKRAFAREARRVLGAGGTLTTLALDPHTGLDRWWIYEHFAGTLAHDRARYPATVALRGWLAEAGFTESVSRNPSRRQTADPTPSAALPLLRIPRGMRRRGALHPGPPRPPGSVRDSCSRSDVASEVVMHDPERITVRRAIALGRAWTSQLADLDDEAWARGLATLSALGEDAELVADLRLWSTTARVP